MTIPNLIQNEQEKQTVVKLKKAYSTMTNAFNLAVQENGTPDYWELGSLGSGVGAENLLNKLAPYLNITKNCGKGPGCLPHVTYKYLDGSPYGNFDALADRAKARLADGSLIMTYITNSNCSGNGICAYIRVDINGDKKPNQIGKDMFFFNIYQNKIVPYGVGNIADCTKNGSGWACTAWVIYKENMDYLHCTGLSWDGKTKCD